MTADRMQELAEAWGGDLRRWPAADRIAAEAFARAEPEAAERALFDARQLDAALDAAPRVVVSAELRDRVIASAEAAGLKARAVWPGLRRLLWVGGASWAAAACAGVVFGLSLTSDLERQAQLDLVLEQASVGGLDDAAVLG
jgi:1,6-anhydro-N-acetylmuramate kinase